MVVSDGLNWLVITDPYLPDEDEDKGDNGEAGSKININTWVTRRLLEKGLNI